MWSSFLMSSAKYGEVTCRVHLFRTGFCSRKAHRSIRTSCK